MLKSIVFVVGNAKTTIAHKKVIKISAIPKCTSLTHLDNSVKTVIPPNNPARTTNVKEIADRATINLRLLFAIKLPKHINRTKTPNIAPESLWEYSISVSN